VIKRKEHGRERERRKRTWHTANLASPFNGQLVGPGLYTAATALNPKVRALLHYKPIGKNL
jgi:hypothetical protein